LGKDITSVSKGSLQLFLNTDTDKEINTKISQMINQINFPVPPLKTLDIKHCGSSDSILDTSPLPSFCVDQFFTFFQIVDTSNLSKLDGEIILRTGIFFF
jgi:hypothetical protein